MFIHGKEYDFDPTQNHILKRGLLDPYTLSENTNEWVVLEEYIYWSAHLQAPIVVPQWMITDLASIPRVFRFLISVNERHRLASLPHDFGYALGEASYTKRKDWDKVLKDFCVEQGVNWWKTQSIYWAVRSGGWIAWKDVSDRMFIPREHRVWYIENFPELPLKERHGDFLLV